MSGFCTDCGETACACPDTHRAKVAGQTVHCERAQFFATPSIPINGWSRVRLGWQLGLGFASGVAVLLFIAGVILRLGKAVFG